VANAAGPSSASVELYYYESIGFRWAQNLRNYDAPEPKRFIGYFERHANQSPKLLARATVNIG
jgi:hypothetical protein